MDCISIGIVIISKVVVVTAMTYAAKWDNDQSEILLEPSKL